LDLAWRPDGHGLLVNYRASDATNLQLGFVSYPAGRFQSLTNDTRGYQTLSLSADGKSMVSIQQQRSDSVFLQPVMSKGASAAVPGIPNQAEVRGVGWDAHGDLLITTVNSILHLSADGARQTTLLSMPAGRIFSSSICARGGPILFGAVGREGKSTINIWRVNADGTHSKQLTSGKDDERPVCSPDGTSFYYMDNAAGRIMKMSIEGGTPEVVKASVMTSGFMIGAVNFSPDGKWIPEIETSTDPATQAATHRVVLLDANANSEKPAKYLDARPDISNAIAFAPDGKAVAYSVVENGVGNIWAQPLDGSKGHWLTTFTSDQILSFKFSPEGKTLGVVCVHVVSDVVLLRDSTTSPR
jgi:Tol biopolymer transport system component